MGCCKKIRPEEEKQVMVKAFILLLVLQTVFVIILCVIAISNLNRANFSWFLPVDIITMLISVILMALILLVVGCASASSNIGFAWGAFHVFMFIFLVIELIISWFSSNVDGFVAAAGKTWSVADDDERAEMEGDLLCCGFINSTDRPALPCPTKDSPGCRDPLVRLLGAIRDTASVALFVDFVLAMFIDFVGCSICFHPNVVTFDDQIREEQQLIEPQDDPFAINGKPLLRPLKTM